MILHVAIGPELSWHRLDPGTGAVERLGAVQLPANVQYAWPHPRLPVLYVGSSDRSGGQAGTAHALSAFRVDPDTGALAPHGAPVALPARPVHLSVDPTGTRALVACNHPSLLLVHGIDADGVPGTEIGRAEAPDSGVFAHQVRATPDGRQAILVTRGNDATAGRPEDPGALMLFDLGPDGAPRPVQRVAPNGGIGFGPRHLDFHPTRPWVFLAVERQSRLQVYALENGRLSDAPLFDLPSRAGTDAEPPIPEQWAGAIRVHPDGQALFLSNRPEHFIPDDEHGALHGGGENSVAAFRIDPETGEPTLLDGVDPVGFHVRTMALDAAAGVLVAASVRPRAVRGADGTVTEVPATLASFRVGADGALRPLATHPVAVGEDSLFWVGAWTPPA